MSWAGVDGAHAAWRMNGDCAGEWPPKRLIPWKVGGGELRPGVDSGAEAGSDASAPRWSGLHMPKLENILAPSR